MIVLEIGQCGIQIGKTLFDEIERYPDYSLSFDQFIVDTELKATQRANVQSDHVYIKGSFGRGNNWANGHFDHVEDILEGYRKLVESKSIYDGCILLHSLAGGTGSGLGTRILSEIRDEFSKSFSMSVSVAPFETGETAVQNYNSLLSLEVLQRCADAVLFISNDRLYDSAKNMLQSKSHKVSKTIQLELLNTIACRQLLNILLPTNSIEKGTSSNLTRFDLPEFVYNLAPLPQYKFCQTAISTNHDMLETWDDIIGSMHRNIEHRADRLCFSSQLVVRGADNSFRIKVPTLVSRFNAKVGPPITSASPIITLSKFSLPSINKSNGSGNTCGAIYNSNAISSSLENVLLKSRLLYEQKAYLHWYDRYCKGDLSILFGEAFESLQSTCDSYQKLAYFNNY